MSDIVERLLDYAKDDHERGCQGRFYDCSCGYDDKRDPLLKEAALEIERLRAEAKTRAVEYLGQVGQLSDEIERLRAWNEEIALNARHFAESLRLIRDMGPMTVDDQRWRVAKDALEGK